MGVLEQPEGSLGNVDQLVARARNMTSNRLKSWVTQSVKALSYHMGLHPILQQLGTSAPAILFYHKVQRRPVGLWGEPVHCVQQFERQMAFLAREYHPISLSELVAALNGGAPLPDRAVAITFDDGYRNNLLLAAPILRHYRVPATLFVATGLVGTNRWMWAYELEQMFCRYPLDRIGPISQHPVISRLCSLGLPPRVAMTGCVEYFKQAPSAEVLEVMGRLHEQLPVDMDEENRFLSWSEIRRLTDYGFELGAHTENHPILLNLPLEEVERELSTCCEKLERETGARPRLFAYPNGDTSPQITRLVGRYFDAAVTTRPGVCTAFSPLLELPRIGAPITVSEMAFELNRHHLKDSTSSELFDLSEEGGLS